MTDKETLQAIVYTQNGQKCGYWWQTKYSILWRKSITVKRGSNRKGTLGTVVVQDLVTDLLDAEAIVRENDPTFYDESIPCHCLNRKLNYG